MKQDEESVPLPVFAVEPPVEKYLGPAVVTLRKISKSYRLSGRDDTVKALESISLTPESEFYSIRHGEFAMIRGPSGGGKVQIFGLVY